MRGRAGCRVLIIERYGFFGGTATAANVNIWHSLYGTDAKTKIIGGIPEEIIRQLQSQNGCYNRKPDGETGPWTICCEAAKIVFDDIVLGSGVKVLLHTLLVDVKRDGRRIDAVYVENKSGRGATRCSRYIRSTPYSILIVLSEAVLVLVLVLVLDESIPKNVLLTDPRHYDSRTDGTINRNHSSTSTSTVLRTEHEHEDAN